MPLTRVVYIETSDFQEAKTPGYYGFCPQQPVLLKWAPLAIAVQLLVSCCLQALRCWR